MPHESLPSRPDFGPSGQSALGHSQRPPDGGREQLHRDGLQLRLAVLAAQAGGLHDAGVPPVGISEALQRLRDGVLRWQHAQRRSRSTTPMGVPSAVSDTATPAEPQASTPVVNLAERRARKAARSGTPTWTRDRAAALRAVPCSTPRRSNGSHWLVLVPGGAAVAVPERSPSTRASSRRWT